MATIEKISTVISELEKKHGSSIPLVELRQSIAKLFEALPASSPSQGAVAKPSAQQCSAMTKSSPSKQCSKNGTSIGSDDKHYCTTHFKVAFPGEAVAEKVGASATAVNSSKPAPKTKAVATSGKASMNPSCEHDIAGKNPRRCTSSGKAEFGGKWYCSTHSKSHSGAVGTKSNDASANSKIAKSVPLDHPQPQENEEQGLYVDQNGLCYLADYEGKGVSCVGRVAGAVMVDITVADEKYLKDTDVPIVPQAVRLKVIALAPEERKKQYGQEQGEQEASE